MTSQFLMVEETEIPLASCEIKDSQWQYIDYYSPFSVIGSTLDMRQSLGTIMDITRMSRTWPSLHSIALETSRTGRLYSSDLAERITPLTGTANALLLFNYLCLRPARLLVVVVVE